MIPKKLKIGGVEYSIVIGKVDNNDCGEYDVFTNTITINEKLPENQKILSLIHESLHAININIPEVDVEFLAQSLYQLGKDNKII